MAIVYVIANEAVIEKLIIIEYRVEGRDGGWYLEGDVQ